MAVDHLTLLVVADTHTINRARTPFPDSTRRCDLGNELVERAIRDAQHKGGFDVLALMGDLTENGNDPGAKKDLGALKERISELTDGTPLLVVPGNHDPDSQFVLQLFNDHPGLHDIHGCRFFTFVDQWDEDNIGQRPADQWHFFRQQTTGESEHPLVVLQHNPISPPIDDEYPFNLSDSNHVMDEYENASVQLSISAHYHPGQQLTRRRGVRYWTSPALSEPPFHYTLIHLHDNQIQLEPQRLQLADSPELTDVHAHTHYAYCAENVTARKVVQRASTFGVTTQCLTEHADQMYLSPDEHANGLPLRRPGYWKRTAPAIINRMREYKREMGLLRTETTRLGLEIELDLDGRPAVKPEDMNGWDILLGSVHWLPDDPQNRSQERAQKAFVEYLKKLVRVNIDVLAHPFRFFEARDLPPPRKIYQQVADLLYEYDTAAEVNFHYNTPDPEFFRCCIDRGVLIATGTDAHQLCEVGALHPHIDFLESLVKRQRWPDVLLTEIGNA